METKKFLKFSVLNEKQKQQKKVSKKLKKINKTWSWKITQKLYIVVGWKCLYFQKKYQI